MKAFLMYRDRDFDPQQLLARRERELRHGRGNEQGLELRQMLPWNEAALRQDLGLDILCNAMAHGDRFLFDVALVGLVCSLSDVDLIRYRQHVYQDCFKKPAYRKGDISNRARRDRSREEKLFEFFRPLSVRNSSAGGRSAG